MMFTVAFSIFVAANAIQRDVVPRHLGPSGGAKVAKQEGYPTAWGRAMIVLTNSPYYQSLNDVGNWVLDVAPALGKFRMRGYDVDFVSIGGGAAPFDTKGLEASVNTSYEDECNTFWTNRIENGSMQTTLKLDEVNHLDYDAIWIPGGFPALTEFAESQGLKKVVREMYDACKLVGTVSTGGTVLVNVNVSNGTYLVAGRNVSAATNSELKEMGNYGKVKAQHESPETGLTSNGANFKKGGNWAGEFSVANNLFTGQGYNSIKAMFNAMDESDSATRCGSLGSCSTDSMMLNFTAAKVTKNNLGNAGPDDGTETLGYKHIADQDGGDVVLRVTAESEYYSNSSDLNGKDGTFGQISIEQGATVSLKFAFWTPPPNSELVELNSFYMSFYDMGDHKNETGDRAGEMSITVSGFETYFLSSDSHITVKGDREAVTFDSVAEGSPPTVASNLTVEEKTQAVTVLYSNRSEVTVNVSTWGGRSNRLLMFGGRSAACTVR